MSTNSAISARQIVLGRRSWAGFLLERAEYYKGLGPVFDGVVKLFESKARDWALHAALISEGADDVH